MIRRFKANRDAAKARLERKFGKRINLKQRTKLRENKASPAVIDEIRTTSARDQKSQRSRILKIAVVTLVLTPVAVYLILAFYDWLTYE